MEQGFIIDLETARDREGADGLLDFPSFGQEHEALGEVRPFGGFISSPASSTCDDGFADELKIGRVSGQRRGRAASSQGWEVLENLSEPRADLVDFGPERKLG